MKEGSIVVVKKLPPTRNNGVTWMPVDDERTPYMIRDMFECPCLKVPLARFEEGIMGYHHTGIEYGLELAYLKEILPPDEIVYQIEEIISQSV